MMPSGVDILPHLQDLLYTTTILLVVPAVNVHMYPRHIQNYFDFHSYVDNVNWGQVLRFWRDKATGCIYVYFTRV